MDRVCPQQIRRLDQRLESRREAGGIRAVDHRVIEADRQAQEFAGDDLPVDDRWFLGQAADGDHEVVQRREAEAPPRALKEHPDRRDDHRPGGAFHPHRAEPERPVEQPAHETGQMRPDPRQPTGLLPTAARLCLHPADLVVQIADGAPVGGAQDVGKRCRARRWLDQRDDIDLVEDDDLPTPVDRRLGAGMLGDGAGEAGDEEGGERQAFTGARLVIAQPAPRLGDIEFDQPVDHRAARAEPPGIGDHPAFWRLRQAFKGLAHRAFPP